MYIIKGRFFLQEAMALGRMFVYGDVFGPKELNMQKRLILVMAAAAAFLAISAGPLRANVTAEQVRQAIQRGTSFLSGLERADGSWPDLTSAGTVEQPGGVSALCTLALLNAGVEPSDEKMQLGWNIFARSTPRPPTSFRCKRWPWPGRNPKRIAG